MLAGPIGLLDSKKGTLSVLMLICATLAVILGKIDGLSYSGIVSIVSSVFMWTAHKTDIAKIKAVQTVDSTQIIANQVADSVKIQADQDSVK